MKHREPPRSSAAGRKAILRLAPALLCAVALPSVQAIPGRPVITFVPRATESIPYLPINGAPPLRFAEAPPKPAEPINATRVSSPATPDSENSTASTAGNSTASVATGETAPDAATAVKNAASTKTPAPILADEARPMVRAEDFLPYFQIPSSARRPGDVTLVVPGIPTPPSPGPMPASSATYTQTPK